MADDVPDGIAQRVAEMRALGVLHLELHTDGAIKTLVLGPAPVAVPATEEKRPHEVIAADEKRRELERELEILLHSSGASPEPFLRARG